MNRGIVIAAVLAAAAAAAMISVRACAADGTAGSVEWESGTNYVMLGRPQATNVPRGKIEVVLCGAPGRLSLYRLDRERRAENRDLDEIRRGDLMRLQGWKGKGFKVAWTLRLVPKWTVKRIP